MRVSAVTPYAGVWIEIANFSKNSVPANVTPYAGVWIEISNTGYQGTAITVTPYAGVWIEITKNFLESANMTSLPTRECGLKSVQCISKIALSGHSLCGGVD